MSRLYRLLNRSALDPQLEAWRQQIWAQRLIDASNRQGRPSGLSPPEPIRLPEPRHSGLS